MQENKKTNNQTILVLCIICSIVLVGLIVFINLNDKTKVYKNIINSSFDVVDKALKKYKTVASPVDKANTLTATVTSPTDIVNLKLDYSPKDKIFNLGATINKDNQAIFEGKLIHQDNKTYLKSNVLNNTYEINYSLGACDENGCNENDRNLNDILDSVFSVKTYSYENLNTISKNLRKVLIGSLDKKYITKNNIKTLVNNQDMQTTRYSYVLNSLSVSKLVNKINNDKDLKDALFATFGDYFSASGITKDNFKDKILTIKDNFGTLNVYKTKNNKIVKVTLNIVEGSSFDVTINDDSVVIDYDNNIDASSKIIYNTDTNKINLVYYSNEVEAIELEIRNNTSNSYTIDYNLYGENEKNTGTIYFDILESDDNHLKGNLKVKSNDLDLTADFEVVVTDSSSKEEVGSYQDLKNISKGEIESVINILTKLEDNQIFKIIKEEFTEN